MPKVAHICTTRLMYKLLQDKLILLSKSGYEVDIISARDDKENNIFNENGIPQKYVNMSREIAPLQDIKSIIDMVKLLKKEKYEIVHTHNAKAGLIGRIAAKIAGVPVIIHTSHGLPFFEGQNKIKYTIFKNLELFGLKISDYFGSQNEEDLNIMRKYAPNEKLFYEGNGVDVDKMDEIYKSISNEDIQNVKNELNIPEDNIVMLMGARFESVKNHDLLLSSLGLLKKKGINNFTCMLAGQGELEQQIRNKVKEMDLEENIIFLGYRKDIYKFIKLADIVALTSLKEGIPRIIMESMYFKKPVVATDVLGTRELVVNNETGFMTNIDDAEVMADNIELLINDKQLRNDFGERGKARIEEKFTEQLVIKRLDSLYKDILGIKNKNYSLSNDV